MNKAAFRSIKHNLYVALTPEKKNFRELRNKSSQREVPECLILMAPTLLTNREPIFLTLSKITRNKLLRRIANMRNRVKKI